MFQCLKIGRSNGFLPTFYAIITFLAIAFIFSSVPITPAQAANCGGVTPCACGDTVIASTTLSASLNCSAIGGDGLIVGANSITIDGHSLAITGNGATSSKGINNTGGYDNVTIKNLSGITNFDQGIALTNATGCIIQNNTISGNGSKGINIDTSSSNTLTGNVITDSNNNLVVSGRNPLDFNNSINTTNLVEGKPVYYLYNQSNQVYDGDIVGDIGMFWCISCSNVTVRDATLSENNVYGVYFYDTSSSTIQNITVHNNYTGIFLSSASSNTLIGNNVDSNQSAGMSLYSAHSNTLTSNSASYNSYYPSSTGISIATSTLNILTNNTANSNTGIGLAFLIRSNANSVTGGTFNLNRDAGIQLGSSFSNTFTSNTINYTRGPGIQIVGVESDNNTFNSNTLLGNITDITDSQTNTYTNNALSHNFNTQMLDFTEMTRTIDLNATVTTTLAMRDAGGAACPACTYNISVSPTTTVSQINDGGTLTNVFTATKSGAYSLLATITDSDNNVTKRNFNFLVDTTTTTTRYYMRGINPTHSQPGGTDAKSLNFTAPTSTEYWLCGIWVQASPDELPNFPVASLSSVNINSWYKIEDDGSFGAQRLVTYTETVNASSSVPAALEYSWLGRNISNLNWGMDYLESWYLLSFKLWGGGSNGNPYWQTTAAQPSYVDYTYSYAAAPAIKTVSNANINILSATASAADQGDADIVLENPFSIATTTTLTLIDLQKPFQGATSTIYADATTTLDIVLGSGASSTLSAVDMDIDPSADSVIVLVDTWETSGDYYKKWTEESSSHSITTAHTIGGLEANTTYFIKVGGATFGSYTSDALGELTFTYNGGYSSKIFEMGKDEVAPTITILGDNPTIINQNDTYTDAGATASDDIDGDITGSITTTTNLNTAVGGYYYITYSVTDAAGHIASSTRNITVRGGGGVNPPAGVGSGSYDVPAPQGGAVTIDLIKPDGVNVLTYINNDNYFTARVSATKQLESHKFKINALDLVSKTLSVFFYSDPQQLLLSEGETKLLDLDNDKVEDISVQFTNVYVNRVELTIKSLLTPVELPTPEVIVATTTKTTISPPAYLFNRNLKLGMSGPDVKELQKYLNSQGFKVSLKGAGSLGKETTFFGRATQAALIKFQKAKKISPAVGYFGPVTRKVINGK